MEWDQAGVEQDGPRSTQVDWASIVALIWDPHKVVEPVQDGRDKCAGCQAQEVVALSEAVHGLKDL